MTISLSQMIADLNAKIAAADSNTPIATVLQYVTDAERLGGGQIIYDSSGVLPTDDAYEGMIAYVADSATLKVRGDYGWAGIADSASVEPYVFPGSTSGYASGGFFWPGTPPVVYSNTIDKFPFTADANATDVGDLTVGTTYNTGQSSKVSGYSSGGASPSIPAPASNVISKFPFSVDANATDVGDLTVGRNFSGGQSSEVSGYNSGQSGNTVIDKFPFSTDANATDVGDLTVGRDGSGQSSSTDGYHSGGFGSPSTTYNTIDKFPFSTDANATDVGDLTQSRGQLAGQSSSVSGYASGGRIYPGAAFSNIIDKFPFATDANATDVGDLLVSTFRLTGQSSTASGYATTYYDPAVSPSYSTAIEKFSFSVDGNSSDVGDLTVGRYGGSGQQV
jgi:hypothetical protein